MKKPRANNHVSTSQLAGGLRTMLLEFENAVKERAITHHERGSAMEPDEEKALCEEVDVRYHKKKQTLLRKLMRIQNGAEVVDVEELKRMLRRMARTLNSVEKIITLESYKGDRVEAVKSLIAVAPEAMVDVERIISQRRSW